MKKILLSLLAVGAIFTANAQMAEGAQARIYAYDLQQASTDKAVNEGMVTSYTLTFKTNCAATDENSAKVHLLKDGVIVATVAATPTDETLKNWEATVDVTAVPTLAAGNYNWSVEVSAPAVESFQQISDPTSSTLGFYRSFAVAVDNSPESDYFGRVYVVNQWEATLSASSRTSRKCYKGIYSLNPELNEEAGTQPHTMSFIGDPSGAYRGASVNDMTVTQDGRVFISSMLNNTQGVYYVNPKTWEYQRTSITSPIAGIGSYGYGEETQLYCINMTNATDGLVQRYDIGKDNSCSVDPVEFNNMTLKTYNLKIKGNKYGANYYTCNSIDPIGSGFFVAQHVESSSLSKNGSAIFYCDNDGVGKWAHENNGLNSAWAITNSRNGCLAVNEELKLVAFTANIELVDGNIAPVNARIFSYKVNSDGSLSTTFIGHFPMAEQGAKSNCLDFDYAGNLYAVNENSEDLTVYAIPTDNNTRVTPAKKSLAIEITTEDIATGLDNIAVDANAPVEYYNMQGVKVENPSNGIFIKKQGNKTTKVVL